MRRRVVLIGVAVVAVVVAVVAFAVWPRGADPVTEAEALEDFRDRDTGATGDAVPDPGVYTFAATGQEEVKLGALPTETRPYPDTVTMVVVGAEDGCFKVTVNLLVQHSEDTTYCRGDDGSIRIDAHEKRQEIGILHPTATMSCDPGVVLEVGRPSAAVVPVTEPLPLQCELALSGGPAQLTATLEGSSTAELGTVEVDGIEERAYALDIRYDIDGDLSGTWTERLWLAEDDHLPLRIERELSLEGLATFHEQSELVLTSLDPAS